MTREHEFIEIIQALFDPNRVKIIKMLKSQSMRVCEMQASLGTAGRPFRSILAVQLNRVQCPIALTLRISNRHLKYQIRRLVEKLPQVLKNNLELEKQNSKEKKMSEKRLLAEWFPEFAEELDKIDELYKSMRTIDEKTYQFICFALSIKARSKPCVLKHFMAALEAGATVKELAYILALTMREAAGGDDCWTHDALGDYKALIMEGLKSSECCRR